MKLRKAVTTDIKDIINIIEQAQVYLKDQGINQWQSGYPNLETIQNDINNENSYVLLDHNDIVGTVAVIFDTEMNYNNIYDGTWISNSEYAVIHRIAVDSKCKGLGLASDIMQHIVKLCRDKDIHSIRVDTHEENVSMQKLLMKNEFQYCGIIYLEDKSKRLAYEKML